MDKTQFKFLIRECIEEVLQESLTIKNPETPKVRKTWGDMNPTTRIHGKGKEGPKPKYKRNDKWKKDLDERVDGDDTALDIQKIASDVDLVNNMRSWVKDSFSDDPAEIDSLPVDELIRGISRTFEGGLSSFINSEDPNRFNLHNYLKTGVNEMTSTGAVQGYNSKNCFDPDPNRKNMKKIAAKSVGGSLA
jgi:hypothetical protein